MDHTAKSMGLNRHESKLSLDFKSTANTKHSELDHWYNLLELFTVEGTSLFTDKFSPNNVSFQLFFFFSQCVLISWGGGWG